MYYFGYFCKGAGGDINSETPSYQVISCGVMKLHLSGESVKLVYSHACHHRTQEYHDHIVLSGIDMQT